MQSERPFIMTVAGFDPCGGAGLIADVKTMEQLNVTGLSVCTAITVQTGSQCLSIEWRPLEEILLTINILMENYPVQVIKIGVIKNAVVLRKIIEAIKKSDPKVKIVWDPVLKSTSEFALFDLETLPLLKNVFDQIDLITPNYMEYEILMKNHLLNDPEYSCAVLLKGGHRKDKLGIDILMKGKREISLYPNNDGSVYFPKHGSGCVLSSAISSWLARGESIEKACRKGKLYVEQFLKSNPSLLGFHSKL